MTDEYNFYGSNKRIGQQHGEALRDEIFKTLSIYLDLWGHSKTKVRTLVSGYKKKISNDYPHLAEEIKGISRGSMIPVDFIYAINARTELFSNLSISECTAAGIYSRTKKGGDVILAQNWDWMNNFRGLTKVVDIKPDSGLQMKMLIEPGMIGKMGFNEAGVGVCFNYLSTEKSDPNGVPVHVMLRNILE